MAALAEAQMSGVWFNRSAVEEAEYKYQEYLVRGKTVKGGSKKVEITTGKVAQQIAEARKQIQETLKSSSSTASTSGDAQDIDTLRRQIENLSKENEDLRKLVTKLTSRFQNIETRLTAVEKTAKSEVASTSGIPAQKADAAADEEKDDDDDDSDVDLFGSDDEDDAEAERLKAERIAAYNEKKSQKKTVIAKSSILLDVKPWDDETDMKELERCVRSVKADGLLWGASKLVKVAFGISKLQISCVVEDDKVGTEFLEEEITSFEDYIQSVDVAAFNKI